MHQLHRGIHVVSENNLAHDIILFTEFWRMRMRIEVHFVVTLLVSCIMLK